MSATATEPPLVDDVLSKLDLVLGRLEEPRRQANGTWRARCPVHGGRTVDDLSVREGKTWINMTCFAGCSYDAIRQALDLTWKDLVVDEDAETRKTKRRDWRAIELEAEACCYRLQEEEEVLKRLRFTRGWAAQALQTLGVGWNGARLTIPVRDAEGKLHDVLRYEPFGISQRKLMAGKGKSRLPWPAPESIEKADPLFLVEGEGTAISMWSIGLRAVSLPGSIGKPTYDVTRPGPWQGAGWHRKWAERFAAFRRIVLLPDLDGPGRALMGAARYDLTRAGLDARIVDLGPRTHDGSDVADMLLKGTYDGPTRRAARNMLREIVAEHAEVLVV